MAKTDTNLDKEKKILIDKIHNMTMEQFYEFVLFLDEYNKLPKNMFRCDNCRQLCGKCKAEEHDGDMKYCQETYFMYYCQKAN